MTAEDTTTDSVRDTATKIQSQAVLRATQIGFAIFFIAGVVFAIQLFVTSLTYFREQADLQLTSGLVSALYPWVNSVLRALSRAIFMGVAALIFLRRGQDRISLVAGVFLVTFGIGGVWYVQYTPDPTSYIEENNLLGTWIYSSIGWITLFVFAYLFPDGRFIWRWMPVTLVLSFSLVFFWGMPSDTSLYAGNWPVLFWIITHVPSLLLPVWGQFYRYRNISTPVQKQQTKWVLYAIAVVTVSGLSVPVLIGIFDETFARGTVAVHLLTLIGNLPFTLIPISLAFAMLQSRLWDIDLIINRSLAYAAVAAAGVLIFFGVVVGLQLAVGQTQPVVALIIAAAFSAVIFNPLRQRIQKIVDRQLYHLRFQVDELREANKAIEIKNPGALSNKTLGKYQVLDAVGKGGMGEVYKATDGTQTVAIKTLLTDMVDDPEIATRFQREAEAGQALNHPSIARVHELAEDDDTVYIVMDYLPGQDLASWLKQQQTFEIDAARNILRDITSALDYAHAQGYVHRDIKPSNIMLVQNDDQETYRAVLMDFGITKIKDANTLTGTGAIGTIDYMAPEQIVDARAVDHRADIYALGVVLYEMLTGERPFTGGPAQVMFAHIQQPAPDPRDIEPDIPRPIAKAILKAMEKSPDDRFDSAQQLFDAFS